MNKKRLAIVKQSDLTPLELAAYRRNHRYIFFDITNCFVLKAKLKEIKELLDQKKTIEEINATI